MDDLEKKAVISSMMGAPVAEVRPETTLRAAAVALRDWDIGALAVLRGASVAGLVSERDITRAIAEGADPDVIWVADVMSDLPRYLTPADSPSTAATIMLDSGIRHLPVVEDGALVGIVSIRDVLKALAAK